MAILGGSPLGLINVRSNPNPGGRSTFNDGSTRNVNVISYNAGNYNASFRGNSLFSGDRVVRAWPGIDAFKDSMPGVGAVDYTALKSGTSSQTPQGTFKQRKSLHNDDVYDTSVLNIIEHLAGTNGSLKMADFAYLKDLGVYPNNRLMIARRFGTAIPDNIIKPRGRNAKGQISEYGALATLISWLPEDSDFLSISFGEKWTDAEADFKDLLNRIGGDIQTKGSSNTGSIMESVSNAIPLPGFTEVFQRKFLANMGIMEEDAGNSIPSGNPNLIKEAKRRTTIGYESAGSGLSCTVDVEMNCEYELKFISGIDPTIVWMDILGMILRFGTSPSDTYGLSKSLTKSVDQWLKQPSSLVKVIVDKLGKALVEVKNQLQTEIDGAVEQIDATIKSITSDEKKQSTDEVERKAQDDEKKRIKEFAEGFLKKIADFANTAITGLVKKYRIEIMGIFNALSGLPSTPWHITIGNPLRPVFCAGDMYTTNVKITLGPALAFNDLPSSIKVNFSLTNARPWGLQEIMAKFNSGYLRTVDVQKSFYETRSKEEPGMFPFDVNPPVENGPTQSSAPIGGTNSVANPGGTQSGGPVSGTQSNIGVGNTQSNAGSGSTTKATNGKKPKKK